MEKVRLTLDDLEVQSFTTTGGDRTRRGTVRGHDECTDPIYCPTADPAWDTCWDSCADTNCCGGSGGSCDGSCDCYSGGCGGSPSFLATNCWSYGYC
ncbi:MAG TPA: hypothetical protein VF771_01670 [Longimicrobiaceae bacterium]